jgi:hypothetical protein
VYLETRYRLEWYSLSPRAWSVVKLWVGLLVGKVRIKPLSHASDGVAESMLAVVWSCRQVMLVWYCWGDLIVAWCRCRVMLVTALLSHVGDDTVESMLVVVWCRCRVMLAWRCQGDMAVACSRRQVMMVRHYRGDLVVVCCRVMLPMTLPSLADDGADEAMLAVTLSTTILIWHLVWSTYRY